MNFSRKEDPHPPIPTPELSIQVLGAAVSNGDFLFGGFVVSEGIKGALELIGRPIDTFCDVLDFGCGSARVLRWFSPYGATRWTGCDISSEAIEWNRRNLGFGEFAANRMEPPLPFRAESFDLIYAVSVVTHLSEQLQWAWLAEIDRVLRPGGIALLTVSGEDVARWKLSSAEFAEYAVKGHLYKHVQEGGLHGLPDFYQDAYHSRAYVIREWARYFQPVAYIGNGLMYLQDLAILEKTGEHRNVLDVDLPLGSFWTPLVADVVATGTLTVTGWTFQHRGGPVLLTVCVDGRPGGSTVANLATPGVANTFPVYPGAQNSGFSVPVSIAGLSRGPHVLSIHAEGKPLPFMTTYFFAEFEA